MSEITKRRDEKLSPWNIPLLIWSSREEPHLQLLKLFSFASCCFGSNPPYSELYQTSSYIQVSMRGVQYQMIFYNQSKPFRVQSSSFYSSMISLSTNNWSFVPLDFLLHPFCFAGSRCFSLRCSYILSASTPVNNFHIIGKHVIAGGDIG